MEIGSVILAPYVSARVFAFQNVHIFPDLVSGLFFDRCCYRLY